MKRIYIALALIIACFTGAAAEVGYITAKADNFTSLIESADKQMQKMNYEEAAKICAQNEEQWSVDISSIDIFLIHDYVDDISESMAQMKTYAQNCSPVDYFAESARAKKELASIEESEYPIFENIL